MTKVIGIICEFNPMHLGHVRVLESARERAGDTGTVICVMSGNFTQRCTPAVFDKYTRARAAISCGADLVVELPFPWSCAGAEDFARGGVSTVAGMGAREIIFASESGNRTIIETAASVKSSPEYMERIIEAERADRELGSAVIFDAVMREMGVASPLGANDKLGSEYVRLGRECGIDEFNVIPRVRGIKSATEIRRIMFENGLGAVRDDIPCFAYEIFSKSEVCREERFFGILFDYCRLHVKESEENDILRYARRVAREAGNSSEFISSLATKKYTAARMRREILFSILGVEGDILRRGATHTVLLGANERGRRYLSEIRKTSDFPIITKPADDTGLCETGREVYSFHRAADELYALCIGREAGHFMKKHPEFI